MVAGEREGFFDPFLGLGQGGDSRKGEKKDRKEAKRHQGSLSVGKREPVWLWI